MNDTLFQIFSLAIDGLVALAGFSAIFIYIAQRRIQKRTAATLVITQIDHIEIVTNDLRSNNPLSNEIVYFSKVILTENYWEKYRHLLSKKLGANNIKLIETFYEQAEELEKSRKDISHELVTAWEHKDLILQSRIANLSYVSEEDRINKINQLKEHFEECTKVFTPNLPIMILVNNLEAFRPLSGTTLYDKLWKYSYRS